MQLKILKEKIKISDEFFVLKSINLLKINMIVRISI